MATTNAKDGSDAPRPSAAGTATGAGTAIAAGAVGMNLEDIEGDALIPLVRQVESIHAVRAAAEAAGVPLVLNARTDIFLAKHGDASTRFDRAVERLNAYWEAGADCLFAPGVVDMLTIIRDRVADLVEKGKSLAEAKAARVTRDYDGRYNQPNWTGDMFVESIYKSLKPGK